MTVFNPDAQWRIHIGTPDLAPFSWSAFSAQGLYADAETEADLPSPILVDPLVLELGFADGQVPAQLEPSSLQFTLWARSADDLPALQRGVLLEWELQINPYQVGPPSKNPNAIAVWAVTGGRVTEAVRQLVPGSRWPARLTVKAVDLLADLASMTPAIVDASVVRRKARERLVQICDTLTDPSAGSAGSFGVAVGLPTGTPNGADPPLIGGATPRCALAWQGNARDQLAAWCGAQDVVPGGILAPYYSPGGGGLHDYPTGYVEPRPSAWFQTALAEPISNTKYVVTSPSRPNPNKLPLRLANVGGVLQLQQAPEADQHTAALDAAVCEIPGVQRSGREHAPNLLTFTGMVEGIDASVTPNTLAERPAQAYIGVGDWGLANSGGARGRDVPTLLELGTFAPGDTTQGNSINAPLATYALPYTPDAYALANGWAFDAITVRCELMSMTQLRSVLPQLLPMYPFGVSVGEGGVAGLVKHVTLYNLDPDVIRSGDPLPQGLVAKARAILEDGQLVLEVTMQPAGASSSGSRITVGDVDAASWHAIPAGNIDPSIRVSDLTLVDA